MLKLTFLGTGTSTGVPQLNCNCDACTSTDPHDCRTRCSALVHTHGRNLLIDCGPDFRQQILAHHRTGSIDALLITHHHYDHVGGTDDLRPYCSEAHPFPVFCTAAVAEDFRRRMPYSFANPPYPGVPRYDITVIHPLHPFLAEGVEVMPLPVMHYKMAIVGFRIGALGYVTDAKEVPQATIDALEGVDTLVINALRHEEHLSHMNLAQALEVIAAVKPRVAYLTHLSHHMGREADLLALLPPNVYPAYDGLTIEVPAP